MENSLFESELTDEFQESEMNELLDNLEELDQIPEEDEILAPDTRKRIRSTTKVPFRYICRIEITRSGRKELGRTGVLIGPRTVLTAGHCIWDEGRDRLEDLRRVTIRVIPGQNDSLEPLPATIATRLIASPGYNSTKGATRNDFGIIHLKDSIGSKVGYWSMNYRKWKFDKRGTSILRGRLPLSVGKFNINICGYPTDKGGSKQYWSYNKVVEVRAGMLHYLNDTYAGHSGSPVWLTRHSSKGGRILVGIHVAKDDDLGVKANRGVLIDQNVRNFISRNIR